MIRAHFEGTVLGALECATRGQPVEDAQIELKATWIDATRASRPMS